MTSGRSNMGSLRGVLLAAVAAATLAEGSGILRGEQRRLIVDPDELPIQYDDSPGETLLAQASQYIGATDARRQFKVTGAGLTAVVIDTGLNTGHVDFTGRIAGQRNFTSDNGGDPDNALDVPCPAGTPRTACAAGHGTNVAGIIAAGGVHTGIAPGASVIPIKIVSALGLNDSEWFGQALQWVIDMRAQNPAVGISVVNISLGNQGNYDQDASFMNDPTGALIRRLTDDGVAVVVAAGNGFPLTGEQGMTYPAILPQTISVGAVYDANVGRRTYRGDTVVAKRTARGRIAPFSQRLHASVGGRYKTDIFAPGAVITSSGIRNGESASDQQGTSQAAPMTAGVVLLMQELYKRHFNGALPAVAQLERWLVEGAGAAALDDYGDDDNVKNTGLSFPVLHAGRALQAMAKELKLPRQP